MGSQHSKADFESSESEAERGSSSDQKRLLEPSEKLLEQLEKGKRIRELQEKKTFLESQREKTDSVKFNCFGSHEMGYNKEKDRFEFSPVLGIALLTGNWIFNAWRASEVAEAERREAAARAALAVEEELRRLGVEPDREITAEEITDARSAVSYVPGSTNVGVVGRQNEGKSTLVNRLRGIRDSAPTSAAVGETEVTSQSTAYVDDLHAGYVWHDVPGGGTSQTTAWGYYYDQKLYAYDKLIVVHTSTLSEIDLKILQIGKYRDQECIVVRTKADHHIRNCKRSREHTSVDEARNDYIDQVRQDTERANRLAGTTRRLCPNYFDHIISDTGVYQLVTRAAPSEDPYEQVIDEGKLLQKLGLDLDISTDSVESMDGV